MPKVVIVLGHLCGFPGTQVSTVSDTKTSFLFLPLQADHLSHSSSELTVEPPPIKDSPRKGPSLGLISSQFHHTRNTPLYQPAQATSLSASPSHLSISQPKPPLYQPALYQPAQATSLSASPSHLSISQLKPPLYQPAQATSLSASSSHLSISQLSINQL